MNLGELRPGIIPGLSFEKYLQIDAVNKSSLDDLARSPAHYFARHLSPNREPKTETPAMKLGTAIHAAILEPKKFLESYAVLPEGLDRRTKEGKIAYAEIESTGKILLNSVENETCIKIAERVNSSVSVKVVLEGGDAEQTIFWIDDQTGVKCKARADYISKDLTLVVDIKTAEDARIGAFSKACFDRAYYRQAAWYLSGIQAATGTRPDLFVFLVCEKIPPYAVALYYASAEMIAQGEKENWKLLSKYAKCVKENEWPAYEVGLTPIDLPKWARSNNEMETY